MVIDVGTAVGILAGAVSVAGGCFEGYRRLTTASKRKKEIYRQAIIDQASEEMGKVKRELEEKIEHLEEELKDQKANISKDLSHMREIYNAEISVLSEKIDSLRRDLADQHTSMVGLLTKLVNTR
jgi:predicted DsbA family dithiol-disulfide isomerase